MRNGANGRRVVRAALLATISLWLLSCGGEEAERRSGAIGSSGWDTAAQAASQQQAGITPAIQNSPLGVGHNRLTLSLARGDELIAPARVRARLYRLAGENPGPAELVIETAMEPRTLAPGGADGDAFSPTVYVAPLDLDRVGWWGLSLDISLDGGEIRDVRVGFRVEEQSSEPGIGQPAPRSQQRTLRDVSDLSELDSSRPPNPAFHQLTVSDALGTGKPVVVAFVSPAFCTTRFCGPVMEEVVVPLAGLYGDRIEVVHIEPWDLAAAREGRLESVPAVEEWGLLQEPFVFVVDQGGIVRAKFEGIMEAEEVASVLDALLAGS